MVKKTEINIATKKEKNKRTEEEQAKYEELRIRKRKIRNQKRYSEIFQISRSRIEEETGKKLSVGAVEVLENKLTAVVASANQKCKRFNRLILKKKEMDIRSYKAQIEILKIKNSL